MLPIYLPKVWAHSASCTVSWMDLISLLSPRQYRSLSAVAGRHLDLALLPMDITSVLNLSIHVIARLVAAIVLDVIPIRHTNESG